VVTSEFATAVCWLLYREIVGRYVCIESTWVVRIASDVSIECRAIKNLKITFFLVRFFFLVAECIWVHSHILHVVNGHPSFFHKDMRLECFRHAAITCFPGKRAKISHLKSVVFGLPASASTNPSMKDSFQGTTEVELERWLGARGVDCSAWGKLPGSKPVALLLEEVAEGESLLTTGSPNSTTLRAVSVVNVRVLSGDGRFLVEAKQLLPSGAERLRNMVLSEKMLPGEDWKEAARRGILEELGPVLPEHRDISLHESTYECVEERKISQSYPGLESMVRAPSTFKLASVGFVAFQSCNGLWLMVFLMKNR
jgi:hypothetical protein